MAEVTLKKLKLTEGGQQYDIQAESAVRDQLGNVINTYYATTTSVSSIGTRLTTAEGNITTLQSTTLKTTGDQTLTGSLTTTGNVNIQGNLNVSGTTTTKDTETLLVQDNMIVSNSNGTELVDLSGLAIKTGSDSAYGIAYDPATDSVRLGLGTLDGLNEFTFDEGEGNPIVVRDESSAITDKHLMMWDATNNKIIDSKVMFDYTAENAVNITNGNVLKWDAASNKIIDGGNKFASPFALTVAGKTYDGSAAVSVTIDDFGISVPVATADVLGGIKIGYTTDSTNQNFAVQLGADNKAYVNVPFPKITATDVQITTAD